MNLGHPIAECQHAVSMCLLCLSGKYEHISENPEFVPLSGFSYMHKLLMSFQPQLSQRTAPAETIVIPCEHELCTLPLNRQISLTEILLHRSWG